MYKKLQITHKLGIDWYYLVLPIPQYNTYFEMGLSRYNQSDNHFKHPSISNLLPRRPRHHQRLARLYRFALRSLYTCSLSSWSCFWRCVWP